MVGASGTALEVSPLWRQIFSDVLDFPVVLGLASEATSVGAALLMAEALHPGSKPTIQGEGIEAVRHEPLPEAHKAYAAAQQRQIRIYKALYN